MNKNSAFVWLPEVERLGVRSPQTRMITYDHYALIDMIDGGERPAYFDFVCDHIKARAKGGYPLFLRTDLGSAKHEGPRAYLLEKDEDVPRVLFNLLQDQELKFFMERRPMGLMLRQFLELDAAFTAFDGLPIAREWRLFVDGEKLLCAHPYWPHHAIGEHNANLPDGWVEMLNDHHVEPPIVRAGLARDAVKVAKLLGGEWSADFACDKDGVWWLTDMATARESYHWPDCTRVSDGEGATKERSPSEATEAKRTPEQSDGVTAGTPKDQQRSPTS